MFIIINIAHTCCFATWSCLGLICNPWIKTLVFRPRSCNPTRTQSLCLKAEHSAISWLLTSFFAGYLQIRCGAHWSVPQAADFTPRHWLRIYQATPGVNYLTEPRRCHTSDPVICSIRSISSEVVPYTFSQTIYFFSLNK